MTVYIEYVILDNLIIDYILLKTTFFALKKEHKKTRLFFSAVLGALFALFYPLYAFKGILEMLIKTLFGVVLVLVSNNYKCFKEGLMAVITFTLITSLYGGFTYALFNFLGLSESTELSIALMFLPVLAIYKLIKSVIEITGRKKEISSLTFSVEISFNGKTQKCKGFLDTGNLTYIENTPVIFISSSMALSVIDIAKMKNLKKISISTVSGEREHYAFRLDEFKVFYHGKQNIYNSVWACIVQGEQFVDYDIIFGSAFIKGDSYESIAK